MKKTRFTDEHMVTILREADRRPVPEVAKRHGVSAQTIYSWRKHFGTLEPVDVKRLRQLEQENGRLKKMVADRELELDVLQEITQKQIVGARVRRQQVASARADAGCRAAARAPYYPSRGRHSAIRLRLASSAMRRPWRSCASSRASIRGTATGRSGSFSPAGDMPMSAERTSRLWRQAGPARAPSAPAAAGDHRVAHGRSAAHPRGITCGPMTSSSTRARMAGR